MFPFAHKEVRSAQKHCLSTRELSWAERQVTAAKRNCKRGKKRRRGERCIYIFCELARAEMKSLPRDIFNLD